MPKVSIVTIEKARPASPPSMLSGVNAATTYFDGSSSLHLHLVDIDQGRSLTIGASTVDRVIYVWRGAVKALEHSLVEGSSIIVEHGRTLAIEGLHEQSKLLLFAAADSTRQSREGGHIHLLPAERVPRTNVAAQAGGVAGGIHADSQCSSCEVWLHENSFPGRETVSGEEEARGVHSHTEDEIIFVTDGEIRLGTRIYGPGTALAIAANTLYAFTAGPAGLRFVNFRTNMPGDIRFANGDAMSETQYWSERVAHPPYLNS